MRRSIAQPNGCFVWTGARWKNGYGVLGRGPDIEGTQSLIAAHHAGWILKHGPIPDGVLVCHHCDNPPCWNDEHLFLGTDLDNSIDKIAKGRALHPAKLTPGQVRVIREKYDEGFITQRALAHQFGVVASQINHIIHRKSRKDVI